MAKEAKELEAAKQARELEGQLELEVHLEELRRVSEQPPFINIARAMAAVVGNQ